MVPHRMLAVQIARHATEQPTLYTSVKGKRSWIMDDRTPTIFKKIKQCLVSLFTTCSVVLVTFTCAEAQDASWIWSPQIDVPTAGQSGSEVFYRKRFSLVSPESAELFVSAGDEYDVYVNGQMIARGESWGTKIKIEVGQMLQPGINTIAAKVRHMEGTNPGLALRLRVKEEGEVRYRSLVTDSTWKTYIRNTDGWQEPRFNDMSWLSAQTLSVADVVALTGLTSPESGSVEDQNNKVIVLEAGTETIPSTEQKKEIAADLDQGNRFSIDPEFKIDQILTDDEVGSVVAMEYDEFGKIYLSQEAGPLLVADPSLQPGDPNRVRTYTDKISAIQGILPLNGNVYVTGMGPSGQGLYLLGDKNGDGNVTVLDTIIKFTGQSGEHGAHAVKLGTDGMLYVMLGNATSAKGRIFGSSPFKHPYEGDLVPRYEDPNGQSQGVKSPGGTIIRTTLDGKRVEVIAGGIRNAYDFAFNSRGLLFFHDSDMETDRGTPWYRPTMIFDAVAGGDFGWRSGWAKFPMHFLDQVPPVVETGRGSPSGAVLYQHINFPLRYQGALFFADWSEGRILSMRTETRGAGVVGEVKTFATGKPMNVCDLAVDPFGALSFCTGGRGTEGGVYRITWKGQVPDEMDAYDTDIARVIRQPQPGSAWGRQQIARLRRQIGTEWNTSIQGVASQAKNPVEYRVRALDLMVLYGPEPTFEFLEALAGDSDPEIRTAVARMCGTVNNSDKLVLQLLSDGNAMVRRVAAESALRQKVRPSTNLLIPMLKSYDRNEALVARRLLERIPSFEWSDEILKHKEHRVFIQGAMALMIADPSLPNSYKVLARVSKMMDGFINDADFVDMLRTCELAMVQGNVDPKKIPAFSKRIAAEFPSGNSMINQELVRLLAYMKHSDLGGRLEAWLDDKDTSKMDKLHAAMMMQTIGRPLPATTKISIIKTLEELKNSADEDMDVAYLRRGIREITSTIDPSLIPLVLKNGDRWTDAALATLFLLPRQLDAETISQVTNIDTAIRGKEGESVEHLRTGIIAVLAQSGDADSLDYLRQMWEGEPDRRSEISLGLAQHPNGDNWSYLVSSLDTLDDTTGGEVLGKLISVRRRPRDAKYYQNVISLGYRLRENGVAQTERLLELWTGIDRETEGKPWQQVLGEWKQWYEVTFPNGEPVITGDETTGISKSVNEYLDQLDSLDEADAFRGQMVFQSANCAKCHRCSGTGTAIGPELTNLASRFTTREIVEAIVYPNAHVADRYQSSVVQLEDGREIKGMAAEDSDDSLVVLLENGDRVRFDADEIEATRKVGFSPMPSGSIDDLSTQEVADLLHFMGDVSRTATTTTTTLK